MPVYAVSQPILEWKNGCTLNEYTLPPLLSLTYTKMWVRWTYLFHQIIAAGIVWLRNLQQYDFWFSPTVWYLGKFYHIYRLTCTLWVAWENLITVATNLMCMYKQTHTYILLNMDILLEHWILWYLIWGDLSRPLLQYSAFWQNIYVNLSLKISFWY